MEKKILHIHWIVFITLLLYHDCEPARDFNNTAGEEIDGHYLLNIGRKMNKQLMVLIGMAIKNLHPCGEWTTWTSCTAARRNHFGIRRRTRKCNINVKINEASEVKTEKDFSICEGLCRTDYVLSTNGFCIKIYTMTKNQEDAGKQCQVDGGNLINIDTDVKYVDVKNLTGLPKTYFHIGGRRKDTSSPWMLADGSQSKMFQWASRQPDNGASELCLVLNGNDKLMHDADCAASRPFLCEVTV